MRIALGVTLLCTVACHSRTELMIGVATDIRAPNLIDEVDLDVSNSSNGVSQTSAQWSLTGVADVPFNLPGSYGIFSADGSEPQVEITLTGLKNGTPIVTRHSILSLVADQTLFYRIGLTAGCETMQDCGSPDKTCVEGVCKDVHLDAHTFPAFSDDLVTTLSCNSGTQYLDTATGQPMPMAADAQNCPASQCAEGTCLVPPPTNCPSGTMLVDGFCACPDGTVPDPNNPGNPCTRTGCKTQADCSSGFTCDTSKGVCVPNGPLMDGGTTGDSGAPFDSGASCVKPKAYTMTTSCAGTPCFGGTYPAPSSTVSVDATGNGDYAKNMLNGVDGSCTSTLDMASCTANINCVINAGGTGNVTGQIHFAATAQGTLDYMMSAPGLCNVNCSVNLN